MRLFLTLDPLSNIEKQHLVFFNSNFNSYLYNILKNSAAEYIHDKSTYKKFCFSEIKGFNFSDSTKTEWKGKPYIIISTMNRIISSLFVNHFNTLLKKQEPFVISNSLRFKLLKLRIDRFNLKKKINIDNLCLTDKQNNILLPDTDKLSFSNKLDLKIKKVPVEEYKKEIIKRILFRFKTIDESTKSNIDFDIIFRKISFIPIFVKRSTTEKKKLYFPAIKLTLISKNLETGKIISKIADFGLGKNTAYGFGFITSVQ